MISVAYIEQDSGIGGAEMNLLYLAEQMDRKRFRPVVIVPFEGPLTSRLKELAVPYQVIRRPKFASTSNYIFGKKIFNPFAVLYDVFVFLPAAMRMRNFLKKEKIDIVHTNSMIAHIYGAVAAKLAAIPCIWHMQDIIDPKLAFGIVRRLLVCLGGILPEKIVVVSKAVGSMFDGKSAAKVEVIYNGTDCKKFSQEANGRGVRRELGISDEELVVGMVGRLKPWKGQSWLLKAAAKILQKCGNVKFLLVGDTTFSEKSYRAELEGLTRVLGLEGRVIFTGFRTDIPQLTAAMDICVLPSVLPDPCPLVLFDYMASSKPVVASGIGGIPEIVEHGKDGLLVEPGRDEELADTIIALLGDADLRGKIASAAREKMVKRFSVEAFVKHFEKLYQETAV